MARAGTQTERLAGVLGEQRYRGVSVLVAHADLLIPWSIAVVLFVQFLAVSLIRARNHDAGYDLAYHAQAAWLIAHGEPPFVTVRGVHIVGEHAYFLLYPLGWMTRWLLAVPTLLAFQAVSLALATVPL